MSDTKEIILSRMLAGIDDTYDKTEGSFIHDALAPASVEFEKAYEKLKAGIDQGYLDSAKGVDLDRRAAEFGYFRKTALPATAAVIISGYEGASITKGDLVASSLANYTADETVEIPAGATTMHVSVTCTADGAIGNVPAGAIKFFPVSLEGLTSVTNESPATGGYDGESDEEFRLRIQTGLIEPAQDGNDAQYLKWATEYPGIGAAKVFPLWNGGNTVKIVITDINRLPASAALVDEFQSYIDPGAKGLGNGVAPIGSKVTITSGTQKDISVAAEIVLSEGYAEAVGAADAITDYLASIVYKKNTVSYMRIGSVLLDCESIAELSGLTINEDTVDIPLVGDEIPVLTSLNLVVVEP